MADPEKFVNWLTNQPTAITNAVNSTFGPSGANHSVGLVPDPGAVAGTTKFLREDATWQTVSASSVLPSPTRAGDIIYWNGSTWVTLAGNNSGTLFLQETSSGVPSWVTPPTFTSGAAGYVPASGGGTVNFLRADGTFSPTGRVLLNTLTASNSATLSDTTNITASFDDYEFVFENVLPATNGTTLLAQVQSGGVFQATSYATQTLASFGATTTSAAGSTTSLNIASSTGGILNTNEGLGGFARIYGVNSSSFKILHSFTAGFDTGSVYLTHMCTGAWRGGTGTLTGIKFFMAAGNITSGSIKLYGLK